MSTIAIRLGSNGSGARCIARIRQYDASLSIADIRKRIEQQQDVVSFDPLHYDPTDEWNDVSNREKWESLVNDLNELGAEVTFRIDGEAEDQDFVFNWLQSIDDTAAETERSTALELGEDDDEGQDTGTQKR